MRSFLFPLLVMLVLVPAGRPVRPDIQFGERAVLTFPGGLRPANAGQIIEFSVTFLQARVESVSRIPLGWSLESKVRPSWQTTVSGSCASREKALDSLSDLPTITFEVLDLANTGTPFQIEARVTSLMADGLLITRELESSDFILSGDLAIH